MGKWIWNFFLLASFFLGCYVIYSFFELGYGVNAISNTDGRLHKKTDIKSYGLTKLRIPEESLKNKSISVYYVPHPDDEILTFGVPIRNDINAGKTVFLVLFTHGEGSAILATLNKKIAPNKITAEDIGRSRVREFLHSAEALGVDKHHRDIYDPSKKRMKLRLVKSVALYFESLSNDVTHNGMSELDVLQEHAMTGKVLNQLQKEGKIKKKETYASVYMSRFAKKKLKGYPIRLDNATDEFYIDSSINTYKRWDPENGWYACGYISVTNQFNSLHADKYSIKTIK
ncbi:PIG-L family deacetylase [Shimazuella kribbensis]|uniref:PIG-L family deacetylase n=1 Tax=Shimazuella kribbensis TaxID=139808 RepID=UPI00048F834C|nr:PIG-L family deacetylase [Shimazuella kribbensis]